MEDEGVSCVLDPCVCKDFWDRHRAHIASCQQKICVEVQ